MSPPPSAATTAAWTDVHTGLLGDPTRVEQLTISALRAELQKPAHCSALATLGSTGHDQLVLGWYLETTKRHIATVLRPQFWSKIEGWEARSGADQGPMPLIRTAGETLRSAFGDLANCLQNHLQVAAFLEQELKQASPIQASALRTRQGLETVLRRAAHALLFAPTSASSTLQQMLHCYLQEQFARKSWQDRQTQRGSDDSDSAEGESESDEEDDGGATVPTGRPGLAAVRTVETGIPVDKNSACESLEALCSAMRILGVEPLCIEVGTQMLFAQMHIRCVCSRWHVWTVLPAHMCVLQGTTCGV